MAHQRGQELWRSDDTFTGTVIVKDINPLGNSKPAGYAVAGNRLFIAADDGSHGRELWGMLWDLPNHLYLPAVVR